MANSNLKNDDASKKNEVKKVETGKKIEADNYLIYLYNCYYGPASSFRHFC